VEWLLLLLVVVGLLAFVLSRCSSGPTSGPNSIDDECPLDRLNSRRPDVDARESAHESTTPQAAREETSPLPEDRVNPGLLPSLRKLSSAMPHVVVEGAKELGESGHVDAVPPLLASLQRRQRSVYFAVVAALLRLGSPCVEPLRDGLAKERDAEIRGIMTRLLEQLDRKAKGLELAPLADIVGISRELGDELAKGWTAN